MGAVRKRVDTRVMHQLPEDVLGGAFPGEFPADLDFAQAQVVYCGDHDQAIREVPVQVIPERPLAQGPGHLKQNPGTIFPFAIERHWPDFRMVSEPQVGIVQDDQVRLGGIVDHLLPVLDGVAPSPIKAQELLCPPGGFLAVLKQ